MAGSGSNPIPEKDLRSTSASRSEQQRDRPPRILIVEDNAADVFLIETAITTAGIHADLVVTRDGEQALRFFDEADGDETIDIPDLVILDINLPRKQGREVLEHMRRSRRSSNASVVAVSTSDLALDRDAMLKLGAKSYFQKPSDYVGFLELGNLIKQFLNA